MRYQIKISLTTLTFFTILFLTRQSLHAQCHFDDWSALKALYENTNGDNWTNRAGWIVQIDDLNAPPSNCDLNMLYGIETDESGRVTCIDFDGDPNCGWSEPIGNNLTGSLPIELGNLTNLTKLILPSNQLTGSIPAEIGDLIYLDKLFLFNNQLSGNIPSTLGNLTSLSELYLYSNKLSGSIPASLGNLTNLAGLNLGSNQLSGNIPNELGNLSKLGSLWLYGNELDGNIPASLSDLSNLVWLSLSYNQLIGNLPPQFSNLSSLSYLDVGHNRLSGCYPNSLSVFCTQLNADSNNNAKISNGNNFNSDWENFCVSGACQTNGNNLQTTILPTNHSGNVTVTVSANNALYSLKNNYADIINYPTCADINSPVCNTITGTTNLAANEVLWATEKAGTYFAEVFNFELPPVVSFVNGNYDNNPNSSIFKSNINKIIYGAGDGAERSSMSSPDIVGHEYMHYIVKNFNNLSHYGESGALHESFADIFGEVLEYRCYGSTDWIFGKQVMMNKPGIRSLKNPNNMDMVYQQPDTYKGNYWIDIEDVCFHVDYCGIHTNSGVQNYWFYLLANGGTGLNDNGDSYDIEGIGIEKAANIAFSSLFSGLRPNATYVDAMFSSIQAAKTLYGDNTNEVSETIDAWLAVGVYDINPIAWRVADFNQTGSPENSTNDGLTRIPVQFNLAIDSLGEDVTADGLSFTLHTQETFEVLEIQPQAPLTNNEVLIEEESNTLKVKINRQTDHTPLSPLPSNGPAFRVTGHIVVIDIAGEPYISGGTQVLSNYFIPHATIPLILGNVENNLDPTNSFNLSVGLINQSCGSLASIRIEVPNNNSSATPSYNYYLQDTSGTLIDSNLSTPRAVHQFYNLPQGNYEVYVEDNNAARSTTKKINIDFVADLDGSTCCPGFLMIPAGEIHGNFNAINIIRIGIGTKVKQGTSISICDE